MIKGLYDLLNKELQKNDDDDEAEDIDYGENVADQTSPPDENLKMPCWTLPRCHNRCVKMERKVNVVSPSPEILSYGDEGV